MIFEGQAHLGEFNKFLILTDSVADYQMARR